MSRLIRCDRCNKLYDPDWKCGCPTLCIPKTEKQVRLHEGKPKIKGNGYPSTILRVCDTCGVTYDPMWNYECDGRVQPVVPSLEQRVEALEERMSQIEWRQGTFGK